MTLGATPLPSAIDLTVHMVPSAAPGVGSAAIWGGVVVIVAAVIAALVAFYGHRITRFNAERQSHIDAETAKLQVRLAANLKLAEMRQAWINSLREDMAAFQSFGVTPNLDHKKTQEFYRLGTKIQLHMNPNDLNYRELERCIYAFLSAKSAEDGFRADPPYIEVCQIILKEEWDVLKNEIHAVAADPAK